MEGNFIGTDPTGTKAVPNDIGIDIAGGSCNTIGGTTAAARNVISGNHTYGVSLDYLTYPYSSMFAASNDNTLQGNFIGTDVTGTIPLPNAAYGIAIQGGSNNTVGGTAAGTANVIAFNGKAGVGIETYGAPALPRRATVS